MKPLSKAEKALRSRDTKTYYVTAVLDKPSSERALRPLPAQLAVQGPGGEALLLTLPPPRPRRT